MSEELDELISTQNQQITDLLVSLKRAVACIDAFTEAIAEADMVAIVGPRSEEFKRGYRAAKAAIHLTIDTRMNQWANEEEEKYGSG